jgi:hypothetical protein
MSNVADEDDRERNQPSRRPEDYLSETSVPVGLRETVHELYETIAGDGSEGGRFENVRLAFRVPAKRKAEGTYSRRSGWLVYRCGLTGSPFAVPKEAPVPMLVMDKPRPGEDGTRLQAKMIHPDLAHDRPQLLQELARTLDSEIHDLLYQLCDAFNLLEALSQLKRLPDCGVADPYPKRGGERSGYEDVEDFRPDCPN